MNCECARWLLYRVADNSLLDVDMQAITAHLAECKTCRDRLAGMKEIEELVEDREVEAPSARLRESVLAAYRAFVSIDRRRHRGFVGGWSGPRVAAMVILSVGLSSGITAALLRKSPAPSVTQGKPPSVPVSLDAAFPLVTHDSYTFVNADGVKESGWKTRIIN